MAKAKKLRVTLIKSKHGRKRGHKECIHGLGLRYPHQSVEVENTPAMVGMITKVAYLVSVEEV